MRGANAASCFAKSPSMLAAVIQPGRSVRDDEVSQAADSDGIAMMFTGVRYFGIDRPIA